MENWHASVRDRGLHNFGLTGLAALQRRGASYRYFRPDRNEVRVMCKHCHSMLQVTKEGSRFTPEDDEKMMWFFMLEEVAHLNSIMC